MKMHPWAPGIPSFLHSLQQKVAQQKSSASSSSYPSSYPAYTPKSRPYTRNYPINAYSKKLTGRPYQKTAANQILVQLQQNLIEKKEDKRNLAAWVELLKYDCLHVSSRPSAKLMCNLIGELRSKDTSLPEIQELILIISRALLIEGGVKQRRFTASDVCYALSGMNTMTTPSDAVKRLLESLHELLLRSSETDKPSSAELKGALAGLRHMPADDESIVQKLKTLLQKLLKVSDSKQN